MTEVSSAPAQTNIEATEIQTQDDQAAAIARQESRAARHAQVQDRVQARAITILNKHSNASEELANEQARSRIAAEIRIERLKRDVEKNKGRAITDKLTGTLNGTGFEEIMQLEGRRTLRSGKSMVIVVLDANDLRERNARGGHAEGDAYLKSIADVLTKTSRSSDILGRSRNSDETESQRRVARWGGDEFGVILEESDLEGGLAWWERTSAEFEAAGISIGAGMQVLDPNELKGKSPSEMSAIISDRKHEADMAMMGVAKQESKIQKKPVLTVYNYLPQETRQTLPQRIEALRRAA